MIDDKHKEFIITNFNNLTFNDKVYKNNNFIIIDEKFSDNLITSCNIVKWGCGTCVFKSMCFGTDIKVMNEVHNFLFNEVPEILL